MPQGISKENIAQDGSHLSRRERERRQRRNLMLEAAMDIFAEKGFDGSSLEEIAERSEFGKGTVYNYFPEGKEGLLLALFERIHVELAELGAAALTADPNSPSSFRSRLSSLLIRLVNHFLDHKEIFALLQKEASRLAFSNNTEKAAVIQSQHQNWVAVLEPAVLEAMDSGELRRIPTRAAVRMILGSLEGFLRYRSFEQCGSSVEPSTAAPPISPEEAADLLTSMLMDGLGEKDYEKTPRQLTFETQKN
jgi:TetR/AcrR family transcriptional regulator, repressor of fatR-cypB operon